MYERSYSKSTDFGGSIKIGQFHKEVKGSITGFTHIKMEGDEVAVVTSSALTAGEITTLNGLVAAHTPDTEFFSSSFKTIVAPQKEYRSTNYNKVLCFTYLGTSNQQTIKACKVLSRTF